MWQSQRDIYQRPAFRKSDGCWRFTSRSVDSPPVSIWTGLWCGGGDEVAGAGRWQESGSVVGDWLQRWEVVSRLSRVVVKRVVWVDAGWAGGG
ncbi:hypothetical protein CGMCC3_g4610 [Colletotrichum fructicola]|nr:uncharacterized protein CGMCC3_g4610 [Colletotrichum fructicola]KAE9579446.1 hypothetical protein CGMCC3_g4610 [Colletotrichum fructicola]